MSERQVLYTEMTSPVGPILIAGTEAEVTHVHFQSGSEPLPALASWRRGAGAGQIAAAVAQLEAYFAGERREFDLVLRPEGTAFQRRVWRALTSIPYGETISYGELARRVGKVGGARAVGAANGKNPIAIVIPCHRVIGADGSLTGYGGGLPKKELLLALEREHAGVTRGQVALLRPVAAGAVQRANLGG